MEDPTSGGRGIGIRIFKANNTADEPVYSEGERVILTGDFEKSVAQIGVLLDSSFLA